MKDGICRLSCYLIPQWNIFDTKTNEGTKLTKLGSEGRSTSTTVLSFSILKNLADNEYGFEDQKLLSFTDNRQDAALQSGHFNDFLDVIKLRSAIYFALKIQQILILILQLFRMLFSNP